MSEFPILTTITFLPILGIILIMLFVSGEKESENVNRNIKMMALWISFATFFLAIFLWKLFDNNVASFQFVEKYEWIENLNISYHLGVDGISLFFVLLTTLLVPICILASWNSIKKQVKAYMISFLLLETVVIGVFCSLDFLLFYIFFEASLIPMFFIIGIWGGENRIYAAIKFFLYTLLGSVLLLVALIYIYVATGTTDITELFYLLPEFGLDTQILLWFAFFASFAVKVPMWPFHTWLPDAHVQAPTAGSVILAGILLKLGGYGFIRFSLPMLPDASIYLADFMFGLSLVAVIYISIIALRQTDMKKLIAYSSIAHMGFVTIGIFSLNQQAIEGAIFQMLSHGLVSSALFLCVGVLYDRIHTKEIAKYGGLTEKMPKFALIFMIFTMASIGLPSTSSFIGEFLILVGAFKANTYVAFLASTGLILGACYMLWLYRKIMFGEITRDELKDIVDLNKREVIVFAPLVILTILFGVYATPILEPMHASVNNLLGQISPR